MVASHCPVARHVTVEDPPKSQVAVQVWPIKAPAQLDGQVPSTKLAVGTDEQLVGGAVGKVKNIANGSKDQLNAMPTTCEPTLV